MTPKDIHIGIEQALQAVGSFIYSGFLKKELDLQFNTMCDKTIDWIFKPDRIREGKDTFEEFQFDVDDLRLLKVVDSILPPINDIATLPPNYRDLISDRSLVRRKCFSYIKNNKVEKNTYYLNESSVALSYNGQIINSGQIFLGLKGISTFTIGVKDYKVIPLVERQNRLAESEYKGIMDYNPLTKTRWDSPLSELYGNSIRVTTDNTFDIEAIKIDYIRKLVPLNSDNFLIDWNTEFADNIIRKIIDLTAKRMLFEVESGKYAASTNEFAK